MKKILETISKDTELSIDKIDTLQLFIWISGKLNKPCVLSDDLCVYYYESHQENYFCQLNIDVLNTDTKTIEILKNLAGFTETIKTVLQELIQWTIENAFNIKDQSGTHYIAIDCEEMRTKFDEWLQKEKEQLIDFHVEVIKKSLIKTDELDKWEDTYLSKVKDRAIKTFNETFYYAK